MNWIKKNWFQLFIALCIIIGAATYYYQSYAPSEPKMEINKTAQEGAQNNIANEQIDEISDEDSQLPINESYFSIPEMGIKLRIAADIIDDVTYTLKTYDWGQSATLSTKTLNELSQYCTIDGGALINKYFINPNIARKANGQYELDETRMKQISDFFVTYTPPQSVCTPDSKDFDFLYEINQKLKDSFDSVSLID
jgi:hypothetical protein